VVFVQYIQEQHVVKNMGIYGGFDWVGRSWTFAIGRAERQGNGEFWPQMGTDWHSWGERGGDACEDNYFDWLGLGLTANGPFFA